MRGYCNALIGAFVCGVATTPCAATDRYEFAGTSSLFPSGVVDFTTPALLPTGINRIAAGSVTHCDLIPSMPAYACLPPVLVSYAAQDAGNNDIFNFRVYGGGFFTTVAYYFAPGTFGSTGVFDTVMSGSVTSARLTILPGIPEPSTWMEVVAGFITIGGLARQSRRRRIATMASGAPSA